MRIVYLHRTQAKGVEGVHIGEIVKAWRKLGHQVRLLSPVDEQLGDAPASASSSAPASKPGLKQKLFRFVSSHLPEFFFELAEIAYNLAALNQARKLGRAEVDFIFERYAIFAFAGAYLSKRWNKPFVVEVNYTSCSALVRERSALLAPLARRVDAYIFRRATGLAAVSTELKRHLMEEFGVPEHKIIVLPNAADPDVFDMARVTREPKYENANVKTIGFVGGFYPWHGLDLLLQAFQKMSARIPHSRLMLVGDGPMMPIIREQSEKMGLADRVILTGRVAHQNLPGYLAAFDVGVMPDSNDYGSPMKIFEYMSLAKPVVVPDYGPLRDAVDDGVEGRIFAPKSIEAMANCFVDVLLNEETYQRMSKAARQKILSKHNWLNNAKQILVFTTGEQHGNV
jgi:glycosyltransferase involved in cell wall biosynthesis